MSKEFDVNYTQEELKTVESGIDAIEAALTGEDIHAKERLLFFLDWYMDPYYQKDLSVIGEPLKELLQRVAASDKDTGIIEEALYLLEAYTEGPYDILEENIDRFNEELKPTVLYILNEN